MTDVLTAVLIIGALATFWAIGITLGRRDLPRFLAKSREEWPYSSNSESAQAEIRRNGMLWLCCWITAWPVLLPTIGLLRYLSHEVEKADPLFQEARFKEQEEALARVRKRNRELERELGLVDPVRKDS